MHPFFIGTLLKEAQRTKQYVNLVAECNRSSCPYRCDHVLILLISVEISKKLGVFDK